MGAQEQPAGEGGEQDGDECDCDAAAREADERPEDRDASKKRKGAPGRRPPPVAEEGGDDDGLAPQPPPDLPPAPPPNITPVDPPSNLAPPPADTTAITGIADVMVDEDVTLDDSSSSARSPSISAPVKY